MSLKGLLDFCWLLFLLLMFCYFWRMRRSFKKTGTWLITKGRIIQFAWTKENHRLWPKIEYVYQVDEQNFTGECFFLDSRLYSHRYARKVAYRAAIAYENDRDIEIFYNPTDPRQSVLDTTIPRKLTFIMSLLALFISLHIAIIVLRLL